MIAKCFCRNISTIRLGLMDLKSSTSFSVRILFVVRAKCSRRNSSSVWGHYEGGYELQEGLQVARLARLCKIAEVFLQEHCGKQWKRRQAIQARNTTVSHLAGNLPALFVPTIY